jgi:hypothetical protein
MIRSFILCLPLLWSLATTACTTECEPGYAENDRFEISVVGVDDNVIVHRFDPGNPEPTQERPCYFAERDVFDVVAGPWEEGPVCSSGAVSAPPFYAETLIDCVPSRRGQLGMKCRGVAGGCASLEFFTYPELEPGDRMRNDLKLDFDWYDADCNASCSGTLSIQVTALGRSP